jgi:hypothetical protein
MRRMGLSLEKLVSAWAMGVTGMVMPPRDPNSQDYNDTREPVSTYVSYMHPYNLWKHSELAKD